MDMCNGPIFSKVVLFAIPIMLSSLLQLFFNAADIVVVGRFAGDNSMAAVGATSSLIHFLINFFMGLAIGTNVLVAKLFGAKQENNLSKAVHTTAALSFIAGIIMTILGCFGAKQMLIWMQTPEQIIDQSTLYTRLFFLGTIPNMIYNYGSAILRAVGDSKRPFYYLVFAGIINVILNLIFVIVLKMDVAGVAIATVISQTISAILIIQCLLRANGYYRIYPRKIKIDPVCLKEILWVGIPAALNSTMFSIANIVIQSSINSFGEIVVAGNSAAISIEGFVYVSMNAFAHTALSFTSQNLGAKKLIRIKKSLIYNLLCACVIGLITGLTAVCFGREIMSIYSNTPEVIKAGLNRMAFICGTYFICGMMDVTINSLRGFGYSLAPTCVSFVFVCGIRLLWIAIFFTQEQYRTTGTVYFSYPLSWLLTLLALAIFHIIVYRKKSREMLKK